MIQKIIPNRGNIGRMVKNKTIENQHFIFWTTLLRRSLLLTLTLNQKRPKNPPLTIKKKSEKENLIPGPKKKLQRFKKPLKK